MAQMMAQASWHAVQLESWMGCITPTPVPLLPHANSPRRLTLTWMGSIAAALQQAGIWHVEVCVCLCYVGWGGPLQCRLHLDEPVSHVAVPSAETDVAQPLDRGRVCPAVARACTGSACSDCEGASMILDPEGCEAVGLEVAAWHILCLHRDQHRWTIAQDILYRAAHQQSIGQPC